MKVTITIDLTERERRAIASYSGHKGLANRNTCREWLRGQAQGDLSAMVEDIDPEIQEEHREFEF